MNFTVRVVFSGIEDDMLMTPGGGHLELCRFLVASNVDPHGHQKDHRNALHWALRGMSWMQWKSDELGKSPNKHLLKSYRS